jgi:hypothetical protein
MISLPEFISYITNGKYRVGCTGRTVYVYDETETLLAKFKDLKYAYHSAFSPKGDVFVVKSAEGLLAIYSLDEMCLVKKLRFSKCKHGQDSNFCFSDDGNLFYNIEKNEDPLGWVLSVYDTQDFSLISKVFGNRKNLVLDAVEFDEETKTPFVLGFFMNVAGRNQHFVAKIIDDELIEPTEISEREFVFYQEYKLYELEGYDNEISTFSGSYDLSKKHSISKLWKHYNSQKE